MRISWPRSVSRTVGCGAGFDLLRRNRRSSWALALRGLVLGVTVLGAWPWVGVDAATGGQASEGTNVVDELVLDRVEVQRVVLESHVR